MKLTSTAFADGEPIPLRYTCDGDNASPELDWSQVPQGTVALALTCRDPDAPRGAFAHWLMWNFDPAPGGVASSAMPADAHQGRNDFGDVGYGGPCPPRGHGRHRYVFTLHALRAPIALPDGSGADEVERALAAVRIATAELIGVYER